MSNGQIRQVWLRKCGASGDAGLTKMGGVLFKVVTKLKIAE